MIEDTLRPVVTDDGRNLIIRQLREDDRDALVAFDAHLPKDDWLYLDVELKTSSTVTWLLNAVAAHNSRRLVAVDSEVIVGRADVYQLPGCTRHIGDLNLVVREGYRWHGVGVALAGAILESATQMSLTTLMIDVADKTLCSSDWHLVAQNNASGILTQDDHARVLHRRRAVQ